MIVLTCHVLLVGWGAYRHSPTVDEPAYLVAGLSHWKFGRFDLCKVSPPLVRMVAAIPVLAAPPQFDWNNYTIGPVRVEHSVGHGFIAANGLRVFWLFTLARWACLPFSLIGAYVIYRWSKGLFGERAALPALLIWCFSPEIIANAQLMAPSLGVTSLSLATSYAFWNWSRKRTWAVAFVTGGLLGLAVLAKTNAIALYPAMLIIFVVQSIFDRTIRSGRTFLQLLAVVVFSIYVINAGYGFEDSMNRFRDFKFTSNLFNRIQNTALSSVPVPFPSPFIEGIDLQRMDFENNVGRFKTYYRGKWFDHGWWWFYAYVALVKVPLGIWMLVAIGASSLAMCRSRQRALSIAYLLIPGMALFALASSQTGFGGGLRYVLPSLPFAYIVASGAFAMTWQPIKRICAVALTWFLTSSLFVYPHTLSYFNELAGGPMNGSAQLLNSDFDWGQDLLFVARWIQSHPNLKPIHMLYSPFMWPEVKDLRFFDGQDWHPEKDERPLISGWYLISLDYLRAETPPLPTVYRSFLDQVPADRIGYTVCIYDNRGVTDESQHVKK